MKTSDFQYELPPELIAQQPLAERTQARMMIVRRQTGMIAHSRILDLPQELEAGDLVVVNNTRVFPARVFGKKEKTGGKVEVLFIEEISADIWDSFIHSSRPARNGDVLILADGQIRAEVVEVSSGGRGKLKLRHTRQLRAILEEQGVPPLPPYIKRDYAGGLKAHARQIALDRKRYQTVYAEISGAIAAPTAGLHFSPELFKALEQRGARHAAVTLHVGPGTFKPVKNEEIEQHRMESERYVLPAETARLINETIRQDRRIVAVGTTVVRVLETVARERGGIVACEGRTSLFIHPSFSFRTVGALLTNFHLPASTLLMLVSAFAGDELRRKAYKSAIAERYRFYSYGDCMLII